MLSTSCGASRCPRDCRRCGDVARSCQAPAEQRTSLLIPSSLQANVCVVPFPGSEFPRGASAIGGEATDRLDRDTRPAASTPSPEGTSMKFVRTTISFLLAAATAASAHAEPAKTREQVRAERLEAIRTGDVYASGDIGLKLNELYPQRYPQPAANRHRYSTARPPRSGYRCY